MEDFLTGLNDPLKQALQLDGLTTAIASAGMGVLFHVSIRSYEVDHHVWQFLILSIIAFIALACTYFAVGGYTIVSSLGKTTIVGTSFDVGLTISIIAYRLFFHRLYRFPGPLGAKVSRFYTVSLAAKDCQLMNEVAKLHEQYGDFIRTGPRELCVVRSSALGVIYGPGSSCLKSTWYAQTGNDASKCSIHMTRDFVDHKKRRKAWDRAFSIKALNTYEPRIEEKANVFMSKLKSMNGSPVDVSAWSMFFSFDVMGEVGFGKDFSNLTTGNEHPAIKGIHDHMSVLGVMSNVPWLLNMLTAVPGATAGYAPFFNWCAGQLKEKQQHWDPEKYPQDIISWLIKAFTEKDSAAAPSQSALDEDGRVVIIAGSETTATTLAQTLWFFVKYPAVYQKLQKLLAEAVPGGPQAWSYEKVKSITYVDDIINESLRLKPPIMNGGPRVTPARGITIDEVHIPGDINVYVPTRLIHTDPRYWPKADEFIPERWGDKKEEFGTDNAPYIPFNLGSYLCPGKNLGMLSLRTSITKIAMNFDIAFAPGENGVDFDKKAMDTFTTTLLPLQIVFTPREVK